MTVRHQYGRALRRFALEFIGFGTPRAISINLLAILGFLAAWPTERLGQLPVRSVWESVFHVTPYSSGMMRALSRLLHMDLAGAIKFNQLSIVVLPLMVGLVILNGVRWLKASPHGRRSVLDADEIGRAHV